MSALELKIPPLILVIIFGSGMWSCSYLWPSLAIGGGGTITFAILMAAIGGGIVVAGVASFRIASTTVNPQSPATTSTLVVTGIYRFTRNPMYLGFLLLLIAWGVFISHWVSFWLLVGFVGYMNRFQIAPEERALYSIFGNDYVDYKKKVRRWI